MPQAVALPAYHWFRVASVVFMTTGWPGHCCPVAKWTLVHEFPCLPQVNMWNGFDTGVPFGGYKMSGIGREKGEAALDHYTQASAHQDWDYIVSQPLL